MYQKDFILRMIEMLGEFIARIFGYIKKGEFEKAHQAIENSYQELLKQDAAFFQKIPEAELTTTLLTEHNYTHGHLEILSELFFAQSELFYAQKKFKESLQYYKKSLLLLEFVIIESKAFSMEKQSKVNLLQSKIEDLKKKGN